MSMFWLRHTFHASIPYIRIWRCFEFAIACASLCGRFTSDKAAYVNQAGRDRTGLTLIPVNERLVVYQWS
jgi:hypothetical protein